MNKHIFGVLLATTLTIGTAQAATIDDFNGGNMHVGASGTSTIAYTNAIGGFRSVEATKSGPLGVAADVAIGSFFHSSDGATSGTSTITWDANGTGLGGIDLTEGLTDNLFNFDFISIDQGKIDLVLTVVDLLSNSSFFILEDAGVGVQSIAFSNFLGVDFTSVDSISFQVIGDIESDLRLDSISTSGKVPEPMSIILMGLGLSLIRLQLNANKRRLVNNM